MQENLEVPYIVQEFFEFQILILSICVCVCVHAGGGAGGRLGYTGVDLHTDLVRSRLNDGSPTSMNRVVEFI